ncbi:MAG: glycoside hydrolase family 25 protein [Muribaculaceae bacterium]|nr:glycoside hydrolase family 25 protein [Alistipes senegalensis]MCM1473161.1 glycoside hydrolase family 25 protein [Muribaculaceae bacterium]
MFKDNKKIKIIALIEVILIIVLAVPLVCFTLLNNRTGSIVPTINKEPGAKSNAGYNTEIVYQQQVPSTEAVTENIFYTNIPISTDIAVTTAEFITTTTTTIVTTMSKNGYSFYEETTNPPVTEKKVEIDGIDVSEFQGYIDWKQVKDSGIDFAFIRIGCRTYADGGIIYDQRFKENLYSADRAGIKTGVYFFSQALTVEEAIEEADAVIKCIEPFNITYPVVFDWEIIYEDYARTDEISIDSLADCCIAFCERVKAAGYTPMIYQNTSTLLSKVDLPRVKEYDIWLAEYIEDEEDEPTYYHDYTIWQYASDGRVPGIATDVDLNISFKDYSK